MLGYYQKLQKLLTEKCKIKDFCIKWEENNENTLSFFLNMC